MCTELDTHRDRRRWKRCAAVLNEIRGGVEVDGGDNVGTSVEADNKTWAGSRGEFEAQCEGERVETCLGSSDDGGRCSRCSMVREAALWNVGGCVINEGASERRGGAKIEIRGSVKAAWFGGSVGAVGGAADRVSGGVTNSWTTGRSATAGT